MKAVKMYINGEWVEAQDGVVYDNMNPYTQEVYASVAGGSAEDAKLAIEAAHEAFPKWAAVPPGEKRKLLLKAADILESRVEEMAEVLANEAGTCMPFARFQGYNGPEFLREAASQVYRVLGNIIPSEVPNTVSTAMRVPVGVVASISPWNCPVILSLRAIAFPIAYGNTVVLKPSSESSISGGIKLAEVFHEAGFPKGVLNVITNGPGQSSKIGDLFTSDKRVRRITFTGSTEVGRHLAEQCGRNLKKISLELGGSSPLIVLKDADVDYAVDSAVFGRYMHQGQICMSTKRIILEKGIEEEFIEKFVAKVKTLQVGDPREKDTIIGPLINKWGVEDIDRQVKAGIEQGATMLMGGKSEGLIYYPTVFRDVTEDNILFIEETFGPVAAITVAEDEDDALRLANKTDFGLSSAVISGDTTKGLEIAERLEFGSTHINASTLHDEAHAPFGGMKDSGIGNNGIWAVEEFTEMRWVTLNKGKKHFPI